MIEDLIKAKFLERKEQVITTLPLDLKYGYIIFEKERVKKLQIIKDFLLKVGISVAGRFGEWEYHNMDHAILSGKRAAESITADC